MPTIKVIDLIRRAEKILTDESAVRWTRVELQDWLNDAYREIVTRKPESKATLATVTFAAGVHQVLTDTGSINLPTAVAILDVEYNAASTSNGRPITMIDREVIDTMVPDWRAATASINIEHWIPDARKLTEFDIYPPAPIAAVGPPAVYAAQAKILYSSIPAQHALAEAALDPTDVANTTVISMDDIYANAILDWMLHKAQLKETDNPTAANLAVIHRNSFDATIGGQK
jgi:hypothetical protein